MTKWFIYWTVFLTYVSVKFAANKSVSDDDKSIKGETTNKLLLEMYYILAEQLHVVVQNYYVIQRDSFIKTFYFILICHKNSKKTLQVWINGVIIFGVNGNEERRYILEYDCKNNNMMMMMIIIIIII